MSDEALRRRVDDYLAAHHVVTLATCDALGPWAAAVYYAHRDATLYFLSSAATRHARAIDADGRVAATVQADATEWSRITGLQLEGRARRLAATEEAAARSLYAAKFPFVGALAQAPAALREAFARVSWYGLAIERACLIDNRLGFGHRDELRYAASSRMDPSST